MVVPVSRESLTILNVLKILNGTYANLNDITVCGKDQYELDVNLMKFLAAIKK